MNITFDDVETMNRAKVAVTNWYRATIESVGKAYFSRSTSGIDGQGLSAVKSTFQTILNGAQFPVNVETATNAFITNATNQFLSTQPLATSPDYATHPLTMLKAKIQEIAAPQIQQAAQNELGPVVAAKLDELVTPESIATHVNTVLTPSVIQSAVQEIITPASIQDAVAADIPAAVDSIITTASIETAVQAVVTPAALQAAVSPLVDVKLNAAEFQAALTAAIQAYVDANIATVMAQIAANKLNTAISVVVDGVIASTANPTLNTGNGTVTP